MKVTIIAKYFFGLVVSAQRHIIQIDSTKTISYFENKYKTYFDSSKTSASFEEYKTFKFDSKIHGVQGVFSDEFLTTIANDPVVLQIVSDRKLGLNSVQEFSPLHLSVLTTNSSVTTNYGSRYWFDQTAGIGVDVMILDSGINKKHSDFSQRVKQIANLVEEYEVDDTVGHGSAVAGVVGSETFGVAKKCNLIDIKVTNKDKVTWLSDVLSGLNIAYEESKITKRPTVIVLAMSLEKNELLNSVIDFLVQGNIAVVTAAGNSASLSCGYSPNSSNGVSSVGAVNYNNEITSFSNYGACVDLFASGVNVLTTGNDKDSIIRASGTSISAGIVAGLVALRMGVGESGLQAVQSVKSNSVPGLIKGLKSRPYTQNKVAWNSLY